MSEPTIQGERQINPEEKRKVYLPLENVKICSLCGKKGERLQICGSCGESVYCGTECQKKDWPAHKKECGKTDRINLFAFYPLIAVLMEVQRLHPEKPPHPAKSHKIINSPNPDSEGVCQFPDGSSARLILLGEKMTIERVVRKPEEWWPTAITDKVRNKLLRRFYSEHFLLPSIVATLVALVAEMYTTTYINSADTPDSKLKRRVRLKYHNSPIADFGIAKGSADVKNQDKFAYFNVVDGTFTKGQDPNDHYWIYFTTAAGEDFILDCGMFTFNFCILVSTKDYVKYGLPPLTLAPAYFRDRPYKHATPNIQYEKERFSVLRNAKIGEAVQHSRRFFRSQDAKAICEFMEKVAGRPCSDAEKDLAMKWCIDACEVMSMNINEREYLKYPEDPSSAIQEDPGEMDDAVPGEDEAWFKYMKKWNRKQRKGEITSEQLGEAFRAWTEKSREERLGSERRSHRK